MKDTFDLYTPETGWIKATWEDVAFKRDAGFVPPKDPEADQLEPDLVMLGKIYSKRVQALLDAFAQTRGYDNMFAAVSYVNSSNAQYKAEAEYCVALRDATWEKANELCEKMEKGYIEPLTWDDFLGQLPVPAWPES